MTLEDLVEAVGTQWKVKAFKYSADHLGGVPIFAYQVELGHFSQQGYFGRASTLGVAIEECFTKWYACQAYEARRKAAWEARGRPYLQNGYPDW